MNARRFRHPVSGSVVASACWMRVCSTCSAYALHWLWDAQAAITVKMASTPAGSAASPSGMAGPALMTSTSAAIISEPTSATPAGGYATAAYVRVRENSSTSGLRPPPSRPAITPITTVSTTLQA
jgi:hypothetical protein